MAGSVSPALVIVDANSVKSCIITFSSSSSSIRMPNEKIQHDHGNCDRVYERNYFIHVASFPSKT